MKETLTLYGTSACHLCDLALALLNATLSPDFFTVRQVDIADSDALLERYGTRIPVLQRDRDGSELNWPFDANALIDFLPE